MAPLQVWLQETCNHCATYYFKYLWRCSMLHHDKLPLVSFRISSTKNKPFLHTNESSVTDVFVNISHTCLFQNFSAYEEACQCLKRVTLLHHSEAMLLLLYFQRGGFVFFFWFASIPLFFDLFDWHLNSLCICKQQTRLQSSPNIEVEGSQFKPW